MSEHAGDRPDTPDEEQDVDAPRPGSDDALDETTDAAPTAEEAAEEAEPVAVGEPDTDTPERTPDDADPVDPVEPGTDDPEPESSDPEPESSDPVRDDDAADAGAGAEDPEPTDPRDDDHRTDREPGDPEPRPAAGGDGGVSDDTRPGADEPVERDDATASATLGAAAAPTPREEPSGWRRLGEALRPRATRSQVLAGVLCAALGFALVVQVQQSASDQLSSARQEDLVRLLDEVTDRAQQLGDEVSGLESTRDELLSGSGQAQSALELAQQRAESEGILSGRLPAQGPGVRVTVDDPAHALKASQMFNVLEELRNAGAEVVELNDVRLVTSTWFEDKGDQIVVDGTTLSSPYEWTVIGDPETLDRALEIPGGALATVRTAGADASTTREDEVKVSAVTPPEEPEYAKPDQQR